MGFSPSLTTPLTPGIAALEPPGIAPPASDAEPTGPRSIAEAAICAAAARTDQPQPLAAAAAVGAVGSPDAGPGIRAGVPPRLTHPDAPGQRTTPCFHCGGSGMLRLGDQRYRTCLDCLGRGQLVLSRVEGGRRQGRFNAGASSAYAG